MTPKSRTNRVDAPEKSGGVAEAGFAGAVARRRRAMGLSLEEVGERVGCAKSYLWAVEAGKRPPPSAEVIRGLEKALGFDAGELMELAEWDRAGTGVRRTVESLRSRDRAARSLARLLAAKGDGGSLDALYRSGALKTMIERLSPGAPEVVPLASEIPLINSVTAGYPADFTDLDYPARVADEYVRAPDVRDPDAFGARVVGDSMAPEYREGDIVVFSPAVEVRSGMDCFVRLEPDHETTFKRVFFETAEDGAELIRIRPINAEYPEMAVDRERVAGLYAGVSVIRPIRAEDRGNG